MSLKRTPDSVRSEVVSGNVRAVHDDEGARVVFALLIFVSQNPEWFALLLLGVTEERMSGEEHPAIRLGRELLAEGGGGVPPSLIVPILADYHRVSVFVVMGDLDSSTNHGLRVEAFHGIALHGETSL